MKSESQIRRHRDDLRVVQRIDCGCPPGNLEPLCQCRQKCMAMLLDQLAWVLDEAGDHERFVEDIAATARRQMLGG